MKLLLSDLSAVPALGTALLLLCAGSALAQTPPPGQALPGAAGQQQPEAAAPTEGQRQYRGLFGGTDVGPDQPGLGILANGYGGYDDDLVAAQSGQKGAATIAGRFAGGAAGLVYHRFGPKVNFSAETNSDVRYYDSINRTTFSHSADLMSEIQLGPRNHLELVERAGVSSLFRFGALPGTDPAGTSVPVADYGFTSRQRVFTDSSGSFSRDISRRGTLTASAGYRNADSSGQDYDLTVSNAGIKYAHQYSQYTNLSLGYAYAQSQYGGINARRVIINGLDLGGGYRHPLSFSRRTTVSFTGGFSMITQERPAIDPVRVLRGIGSFGVDHEMGRTWTLNFEYDRGVQYIEIFPDPFFVDAASISLSGLLSRRIELSSHAAYANGQLQLNSRGSGYRSYSSVTDLSYAFNTQLALALTYAYYNYDFGSRVQLPAGLSQALERQSIRLGLRCWVPVKHTR